jgi:hypothetical protein
LNGAKGRLSLRKPKHVGCLLTGVIFTTIIGLLAISIPSLVHQVLNRKILPDLFANPDIPLSAGSIKHVGWHELQAVDLTLDSDAEMLVTLPEVNVTYSPGALLKKRIASISGHILTSPVPEIRADFRAEEICLDPEQLEAMLSVTCPRFVYNNYSVGPIQLSKHIQGTATEIAFDLPLQDGLMTSRIALDADWKTNLAWNCSATLPLQGENNAPLQLGALVPGAKDLEVLGTLQMTAAGDAEETTATVDCFIKTLLAPEHSLSLTNLSTRCALQLAGGLRSLPQQMLNTESISMGELTLKNLRMQYQLEPSSVFYIENLEFDFCKGQVGVQNVRIPPHMTNLTFRLQCDRLSLEQVMASCGVDSFSGDGELNGRVPIRWANGAVHISQGFLFTTPGHSGTFKIGQTEALAAVLPAGSSAKAEIRLVSAALKNFDYDWITLTLNSEGEDLIAVVEISGMPANELPFQYDSRNGNYVEIELKKPGQGFYRAMRFTLNFNVPLNQLLCDASGINKQWNLFKQNSRKGLR